VSGWSSPASVLSPHSSILSSDILGQVYEQFLGKVIRLTAGHQAKVEEKPEVRKAGGVYYTPTYIVDYIVKNTVGRLREGGPPARLTSARHCSKMRCMSAQRRPSLTSMELTIMETIPRLTEEKGIG